MTIEERATQLAYHEVWENCDTELHTYIDESEKKMYIDILTEQDLISRQEERERCIRIAQEWNCKVACNNGINCSDKYKDRCVILEGIRKSMEGGSDGTES